jgi:hypothetical protein
MSNFKWFAPFVLAAAVVSTLPAEIHCPGNVASVPLRLVNRYQMIVAMSVDDSGPYNFLLDTGTEITMIDTSLAGELHLETHGTAVVASAGFQAAASFSQLDELAAGTHAVVNQKVLVFDLHKLRFANLSIAGILGEDFLEHFDMMIDNAHNLLCLDDTGAMRADVKGTHVPLLTPAPTADGVPLPKSLIIAARLSDGARPLRLQLDSGTNAPFLYNTTVYMALGLARGKSLLGSGVDGTQRTYSALPLQDVKIGSLKLPGVLFITLVGAQNDSRTSELDGLLSTGLFRRVFICHTDHFAVLDRR